jgi:hypothetical protein
VRAGGSISTAVAGDKSVTAALRGSHGAGNLHFMFGDSGVAHVTQGPQHPDIFGVTTLSPRSGAWRRKAIQPERLLGALRFAVCRNYAEPFVADSNRHGA